MAEKLFKGIRQVSKTTFDGISDSEKIGILWFVREFDGEDNVVSMDIYLGTRHYGHYAYEDQSIRDINTAIYEIRSEILELYNQIEDITKDLKLEEATDETISEGHIELKRNDNGELYGLMYYQE